MWDKIRTFGRLSLRKRCATTSNLHHLLDFERVLLGTKDTSRLQILKFQILFDPSKSENAQCLRRRRALISGPYSALKKNLTFKEIFNKVYGPRRNIENPFSFLSDLLVSFN